MDKVVVSVVKVRKSPISLVEMISRQLVGLISLQDRFHPGVKEEVLRLLSK